MSKITFPNSLTSFDIHSNTTYLLWKRRLEPLAIMFSGGRTSAVMLRLILDIYGGEFPKDGSVIVLFQNTGREVIETLNFVRDVSLNWSVPITWLEYDSKAENRLRIVNHNSASRNGEPFWNLFTSIVPKRLDGTAGMRPLPGPGMRICTAELKIHLAYRYLTKVLGWKKYNYFEAIGLRRDEPLRVTRQQNNIYESIKIHPLNALNVTADDVMNFWKKQPFNLELPMEDPSFGNCDLCFLKSADKIKKVIAARPELANFWIDLEEMPRDRPHVFRKDRPSYRELRDKALSGDIGFEKEDVFINSCSCTD